MSGQQHSDPGWLDDLESPPEYQAARRLCIVASDPRPFPCSVFVAALQTAVNPHDELEVILDRRRGGPATDANPGAAGQPSADRRRHPNVDVMVRMDGFAIVPLPATEPRPAPTMEPRRIEPRGAEPIGSGARFFTRVPDSPRERHIVDDADGDEEELERILRFKRRQEVRVASWVVLTGLMGLTLVLLLQLPAVKSFMSGTRPAPSPSADQPVTANRPPTADRLSEYPGMAAAPSLTETSPPPTPPAPGGLSENLRQTPAGPERPEPARPPAESTVSRAVPGPSASPGPITSFPPPGATRIEVAPPRFSGVPRVELFRNLSTEVEGRDQAYAVRISDTAGRPLAGAQVLLLARMADGTVESIALGDGPEPGTYHGTAPPSRSAPVDLRIRMTMSDRRVEIPLRP